MTMESGKSSYHAHCRRLLTRYETFDTLVKRFTRFICCKLTNQSNPELTQSSEQCLSYTALGYYLLWPTYKNANRLQLEFIVTFCFVEGTAANKSLNLVKSNAAELSNIQKHRNAANHGNGNRSCLLSVNPKARHGIHYSELEMV